MSSAASAANQAFGIDRGLPFPLADVEQTDVLVLVGSNLAETMPPAARHLDRLRERGGRVVVIDPRHTADRRAGGPVPPAGARAPTCRWRSGCCTCSTPPARSTRSTSPPAPPASTTYDGPPPRGGPSGSSGCPACPARELRELAALLAGADRVIVLTARGAEQHSQGTATVLGWINVALALGMPGKEYAGYGCLTGQGNGQGGREHGQKADQLPGYRMIDDPAAREHVARVWGVDAGEPARQGTVGVRAARRARHRRRRPRAAGVRQQHRGLGAQRDARAPSGWTSLDLLVVADIVMSETAAMADVVLPVTQWAEETGTMTNLEGRVILRERAVAPPEGVRSDLEVLAGLAERLGSPVSFGTEPEAIFAELGAASAGGKADYAGIDYDRIRARARGLLALPDLRPRRDAAACSRTPSPPRTAAPGSSTSSTWAPPSSRATTTRCT